MINKSIKYGFFSSSVLLLFYFGIISLLSGWDFAWDQFKQFWYFVLPLAVGFGLQVGLYVYLRQLHKGMHAGKVTAVSGTTSTIAMISCCSHYLANILPILGVTGLVTFFTQYQIELFWVGLAANLLGLAYICAKVLKTRRMGRMV